MSVIIYSPINIFDYEQKIYLCEGDIATEIGKAPLENVDQLIVTYCDKHNVTDVFLDGPQAYTAPLKDRIQDGSVARYNKGIKVTLVSIRRNDE